MKKLKQTLFFISLLLSMRAAYAQASDSLNTNVRTHSIWLHAGGGTAISYKGNSLFTLSGSLNYVYRNHFISGGYTLGISLAGLTTPDYVTLSTTARLVYGKRYFMSKSGSVIPFGGIGYIKQAVSTYRYDGETEAATGAINSITGSDVHTYTTINQTALCIPVGVQFMWSGKYYGFSLEPHINIGAFTSFGLKVGVLNVGVVK